MRQPVQTRVTKIRHRVALLATVTALALGAGVAHGQLKRGGRFEKGGGCLECHEDMGRQRSVSGTPPAEEPATRVRHGHRREHGP